MGWAGEREKASQHKRAMNTEPRNPISLGGQALPSGQMVAKPDCELLPAAQGSAAAEGARGAGDGAAGDWRCKALNDVLTTHGLFTIPQIVRAAGMARQSVHLDKLPEPWACPLSWEQVPAKHQRNADRLRKAMGRALKLRADASAAAGAVERAGLDDFKAEFGYTITGRHWRRLMQRTIERDGGAENWERLEIYIDDRALVTPKPRVEVLRREADHSALDACLSSIQDRANPTATEREFIWGRVFSHYEELTANLADSPAGNRERRLIRASLGLYLWKAFPAGALASTDYNLRRRLEEKIKGGPESWKDNRNNSGPEKRKLCPTCRPLMIGATVDYDKNYRLAWRQLHKKSKLCDACRTAWKHDVRAHKSYVPRSVIEDIRAEVEAAWTLRRGPKYRRLMSPSRRRDWSDTGPGDYSVLDDMTPDHAVYGPAALPLAYDEDANGRPFVGRMECLFSVDERTDYPLAFIVILGDGATANTAQRKASYNQIHQRQLLLRQHDSVGMPHIGFKQENGPWRNNMMDGCEKLAHWRTLDIPIFETGLREMGICIRRAIPGNPRSKIIERVFSALHSRMKCHPGYLGNNERMDRREGVLDFLARVKGGKEHPGNELMSVSEFIKLMGEEFMEFANDPQNGDRLPGVTPLEAFQGGIDGHPGYKSRGMRKFPDSARFLLSTHEKELYVGPQGVTYKIAGHRFPFFGPELLPYKGQKILGRLCVEQPKLLACRAANGNTFNVEAVITKANTETPENQKKAARDCADYMRQDKVLYDGLPHPFRFTIARDNAHSEEVRKYGENLNRELAAVEAKETAREQTQRRANTAAAKMGVPREVAARHPDRVLVADEMRREAERLRAEEES